MSEQDNRQQIVELLPFWANGTLSPEEQELVKAAMEQDATLRQEAEMLSAIRAGVKNQSEMQSPGELGLARLRRAVDESAEQAAAQQPLARRTILSFAGGVAAALAAIALFSTLRVQDDVYELASSNDDDANIVVMFRSDVPQASMAALLQAHDLVIVDGPSAIGLYRLSPLDPETDLALLAEELRLETEIFESVDLP